MKELLKSRLEGAVGAIVTVTLLAGGVFSLFNTTASKPLSWTEKDLEMYAGEVLIPNTKNGKSKIDYSGILYDLDYDGKVDMVAHNSWVEMIAEGYEERVTQRSKSEGWMIGKFETLDERTREDLTKVYTTQKDFQRNYLISKGLYSTNTAR